jgi:hypothetical protein
MPTQEVALIPATAADRWKYAESLADANLIPAAFRRRPADVFYAVEYGAMLGLSPIAALTGIHVIEGKPTASSALMSALVRKAGHRLRVRVEGTVAAGTLIATAELVRSDDPDHTFIAVWDLHRAERAGLIAIKKLDGGRTVAWSRSKDGKPQAWEKFTEAMAKARAISEVCRDGAEECLFGMHYTPEELGAEVDGDGEVVEVTVTSPAAPGPVVDAEPVRPAPGKAQVPAEDVVDAEVVPDVTDVTGAPPETGVTPVDKALLDLAVTVATRAGSSKDVEEIRRTYTGLREKTPEALKVDVAADIDPLWAAAAGVTTPCVELGAWLIACGNYVKSHPDMAVADGALDPALTDTTTTADASATDTTPLEG